MYLENNYALVKDDLKLASRSLSALFGENISVENVRDFEIENHQTISNWPRVAERGAFGRRDFRYVSGLSWTV